MIPFPYQTGQLGRRAVPVAGGSDPNFANVSLLLHMDGTNGSTTFTDSSPNNFTVTPFNQAQISTAQSKFGGASGLFDGASDYLTVPDDVDFAFGTGDFTIELWARFTVANSGINYSLVAQGTAGFTSNAGFFFLRHSSNNLRFIFTDDGTGASGFKICDTPFSPTVNVWYHLAVTRSGTSIRLFIDGVLSNTLTSSAAIFNSTRAVSIAADEVGANGFSGYMDDLRITKGVARYTANFTPPTAPFPDS